MVISLTRAEGPTDSVGRPRKVDGWQHAKSVLLQWARTAPKDGSYDKCDFKIEIGDATYTGRYDLVHESVRWPDLLRHVTENLEMAAGIYRPHHLSENQWGLWNEMIKEGDQKKIARMILMEFSKHDPTNFCYELTCDIGIKKVDRDY